MEVCLAVPWLLGKHLSVKGLFCVSLLKVCLAGPWLLDKCQSVKGLSLSSLATRKVSVCLAVLWQLDKCQCVKGLSQFLGYQASVCVKGLSCSSLDVSG